jgi:hypothetical protein
MLRSKLLAAASLVGALTLSPYTLDSSRGLAENTACAAEASGSCTDAGCIGGNSLCADLANGTRCYTTIIIKID